VLLISPTPRQREFACGPYIGTTQGGASLAAPLDSLLKRSSLRPLCDIIIVLVTCRNIMTVSTLKVCTAQVRQNTFRVYARAVPIFLKYDDV